MACVFLCVVESVCVWIVDAVWLARGIFMLHMQFAVVANHFGSRRFWSLLVFVVVLVFVAV